MSTLTNCPNCSTPLNGEYCSNCGQHQEGINRFFLSLMNEALEDVFSFNSRAWKTLFALLFRPGFLSNEYFRGRRARYVQPIRLYFITSISFFLMLSVINFFTPPGGSGMVANTTPELGQVQTDGAPGSAASRATSTDQPVVIAEPAADGEALVSVNGEFDESALNLTIPFVSEETGRLIEAKFRAQVAKAIELAKESPQEVSSVLLELAPPVIFCLLPIFAILLKLFYITKRFYYAEHLIFAVHTHCFVFLTLTFYSAIEVVFRYSASIASWIGIFITVWIPLYLWRSLKNVYQQGRFFTTLKFLSLGLCYTFLLAGGILLAVLVGVMAL